MAHARGRGGVSHPAHPKNTAGEIFEYCVELARGDSNKFQIVLKNSGVQYSRVL